MKQPKPNAKSIRMTDEIFQYINNFEGEGFNEKLQNIVLFSMQTEADRRRRLEALDNVIAEKQELLYNKLVVLEAMLTRCQHGLESCREALGEYTGHMEAGDSEG